MHVCYKWIGLYFSILEMPWLSETGHNGDTAVRIKYKVISVGKKYPGIMFENDSFHRKRSCQAIFFVLTF